MTRYAYSAIDVTGQTIDGVIKSDTLGEARSVLMAQNLYPVKIEEKKSGLNLEFGKPRVKKKELMQFTRQLAVFVKAGIPLTEALQIIADESPDVALQRTLMGMVEDLRNGGTLSGAASKYPEAFPEYYVGILGSAELTGKLDETMENLAGYLEREIETRAKVTSALSYPGVVMVLALFTMVVLAGYVLPQFKPLFEELDAELPPTTRALLFIADLFTIYWYAPFTFFASITGWIMWLVKTPKGKATRDRMFLKLPVISGIISYSILERFCRILGAMVRAGVPLPDAMKTTTTATSNVVFHERLEHARLAMLEGGGFAKPLAETELFPGAARQMFKVGEETGTLDDQLSVASMYFDRELEQRIRRFTTMFEPIMIIFVGLVVGFVAVALVQAMYGVLGSVNE
ncbi:MAG: type secretion system protein [Actinomycetota bacterium]|jgi:type IV pilus assembly protein PilC